MLRHLKTAAVAAGLLMLGMASASADDVFVPNGYPSDYRAKVEKAQSEGDVLIYGNLPLAVWKPALAEFARRYPTIKVQPLDLGDELFERYQAETASKARTADMIIYSGIGKWLEFAKKGEIAEYKSPEDAAIPDWARPLPGLFVLSADPYLMAYNKLLIPENRAPHSMADVAALVKDMPELKGKLTTFDAGRGATGEAVFSAWTHAHGDAGWSLLDTVGPATRPELGIGAMMDKLLTGEYAVAYFGSASGVLRNARAAGADKVVGYSLIKDGTPIMMRGAALTKGANHPEAAQVLMDFLLSREGQLALSEGLLTPYRKDIQPNEVKGYTYNGIVDEIGESNVNIVKYDPALLTEHDAFVARWSKSFRGAQ